MKKMVMCLFCLAFLLLISFVSYSKKLAPTTQVFNPWCHTFNKPYTEVFDKTKTALVMERALDIFDYSKEEHFIYGILRGSNYVDAAIRFKEESKSVTKVIVRCFSSKTSRGILKAIGNAIGEPLPTKPPRIKHRESTRAQMTYFKEDMAKECKPYMEYFERE